jgi:hypothetical protein
VLNWPMAGLKLTCFVSDLRNNEARENYIHNPIHSQLKHIEKA